MNRPFEPPHNAFQVDQPGTDARTAAEGRIERLRLEGGVFVEAVRATRLPMAITDPTLSGNPIVFANDAFLALSGYSMDEVLGQQPHFMNGPGTDPADAVAFREALEQDRDAVIETVQYRKGGARFLASVFLSAFKNDDGRTAHQFLTYVDVTARETAEDALEASRQREAHHLFLAGLGEAMRGQASAALVIEAAARLLGEHLGVSRVMFAEFDEARGVADIFHGWFADGAQPFPEVMRLQDYEGPVLDDLRAGRIVRVEDAGDPSLARPDLAAIAALGVTALLSVPLIVGGRLVVNLSLHQHEARRWTDAEAALTQEAAERLWAELVRFRAEQALRESEARYRSLFETMGQGFCELELIRDSEGRAIDQLYLKFNPAFERLFGIPVAEAEGRRASDLFPDLEPAWMEAFDRAVRTRSPQRIEHRLEALDRWFDVLAYPSGSDRLTALFEDVTERKRAEIAAREGQERQAFLLKLSDTLRQLHDPASVQAAATRLLAENLAVTRAVYTELRTEDGREYVVVEADHRENGATSIVGRYPAEGFGSDLVLHRAGRPVVVADTEADLPSEAERETWRGLGARSYLGAPYLRDGRLMATFGVQHAQPRVWTASEVLLVQEAAERTWGAAERARAETSLRSSEARYRDLFERIEEGFCIIEVIFDEADRPVDYRFLEVNPAFKHQTGIADAEGRLMRDIAPDNEQHWFDMYGEVALTGRPVRLEAPAKALGDRWYALQAYRVGEPEQRRVAILFTDISQEHRSAEALRESEGRFRTLAEQTEVGVAMADRDGRLLWVNDRLAEIVGREPEELRRLTIRDVTPPEDWPENDRLFRRMIDHGVPFVFEKPLGANGQARGWNRLSVSPRRDGKGRIVGGIAVAVDITERRRAEVALRDSEARLRLIVESARDYAIFALDTDRRIDAWPAGAQSVFGWSRDEIEGQSGDILYTPEDRAEGIPEREAATALLQGQAPDVRWHQHKDGRRVFIEGQTVPLFDGERHSGFLKIGQDVTARRADQEALRESEERFRRFGAASQDIIWIREAETLQWQYLTPAFEEVYGLSRREAVAGDNFRNWLDLIAPEDRAGAMENIERVREGEHVTFEYRVRRPVDGATRWLRDSAFPISDETGRVKLIGGVGHDLTELREAETRLRVLMEGIPQLVWRAGEPGEWAWASPQWTAFTGQSQWDSLASGWLGPLHPDDRSVAKAAWSEASARGGFEVEYRIRNADSGAYRWFQTRATPVRDEGGAIIEWLGTSTDVHELRELQDRQKVLVAELQHRTRNLMGVVRSVSDKTARSSVDLSDFRARFRDRIDALSRVQGLLSRLEDQGRVTFDELIEAELRAIGEGLDHVTLNGPSGVRLRSSTVQTLAMALHELATNALKYGALAQPAGRLEITWRVEPAEAGKAPWLHIDWRERGVTMPPPGAPPAGAGQGRELIERALPYQLQARTTYALGPDGVHCTIAMPISQTAAPS